VFYSKLLQTNGQIEENLEAMDKIRAHVGLVKFIEMAIPCSCLVVDEKKKNQLTIEC
jgi:hypothetical protein